VADTTFERERLREILEQTKQRIAWGTRLARDNSKLAAALANDSARRVTESEHGTVRAIWGLTQSLTNAASRAGAAPKPSQTSHVRPGDAGFVQDADGFLLELNRSAEDLLSAPRKEILGRRFLDFVPPEEHAQVTALVKDSLRGEGVTAWTIHLVLPDDSRVRVELSSWLLDLGSNQVLLWFAHRTPEASRPGQPRVDSEPPDATDQLVQAVAHDFNNLLGIINAYCEVLRRSAQDDAQKKSLKEISGAAARAAELTRRLIAPRPERAEGPAPLDWNEAVADFADMVKGAIENQIALVLRLEPTGCPVKVDRGQLDQVLLNLVVNARDAMPNGGVLTIETSSTELGDVLDGQPVAPGRYAVLSVSDTGVGIDDEIRKRMFEPFFTTKEEGKGTGLGLATVQRIVSQNGGYVSVSSRLGEGTTMRVFLWRA
jgi:PAS domain S-box-containing protein